MMAGGIESPLFLTTSPSPLFASGAAEPGATAWELFAHGIRDQHMMSKEIESPLSLTARPAPFFASGAAEPGARVLEHVCTWYS